MWLLNNEYRSSNLQGISWKRFRALGPFWCPWEPIERLTSHLRSTYILDPRALIWLLSPENRPSGHLRVSRARSGLHMGQIWHCEECCWIVGLVQTFPFTMEQHKCWWFCIQPWPSYIITPTLCGRPWESWRLMHVNYISRTLSAFIYGVILRHCGNICISPETLWCAV